MKKLLFPIIFIFICGIFFYPTLFQGKLPVPTDTLIGLYHPWRDLYAATNPRGVPYKNFLITDPVRQQIPWKKLVADSFKQGTPPLWNPYSFSGVPLLGNIQAGALYPLNVLFLILPFSAAWTMLIVLQPVLAGLFFYIFLKRKNIHAAAALFGAIVWSFGGFFIAWLTWGTIDQTALWLPLMLVAIDSVLNSVRLRSQVLWAIILALSLALAFLAGHAQVAFYVILFSAAYALFQFFDSQKKTAGWWLFGAGILAVMLTYRQWVPFIQLVSRSGRAGDIAAWLKDGWFLPWQHLVQFIVPDFFGNPATLNYWGIWNYGEFIGYAGILTLTLAAYCVIARRDRLTRFFAFGLGIVFLFLLPTPIAKIPFELHIPILSAMQPTRLMVLVDFCLAVLAALGLDAYVRKPDKKIFLVAGALILILLALWGYAFREHLGVSKNNLVLPSVLLAVSIGILYLKRWKYVLVASVIGLTVFDLFRFGWKFTPFTPREYFFPTTQSIIFLQSQPKPFRVMSLDARILPPNTSAYYGIESVEGYDPIYDSRYEEFIAALNRQKPDIKPPFGFNRIITVSNTTSRLLPLLNVKYILSLEELKGPGLEFVYQEGETRIYRYLWAMPRIYPVESVMYSNSKQQTLDILYGASFNPVRQAVVEGPVNITPAVNAPGDHIDVAPSGPALLRAFSSLSEDHFVVIANMFDSGWKASIDSNPIPIYRTDYLFQGIRVPRGNHSIVIEYQ